jgi:O-antigen/teichoic acid export membrane protein
MVGTHAPSLSAAEGLAAFRPIACGADVGAGHQVLTFMSLSTRFIRSTGWNTSTNLIRVLVMFVRFTLLSRWLPKEVFGTYSTAALIVTLTITLAGFGIGGAFLNRERETEDEDRAAQIHLSLRFLFTLLWTTMLVLFALLFVPPPTQSILIVLTLIYAGLELLQVPRLIFVRRVEHQRLALIELLNTIISSALALWVAWVWRSVWALLIVDLTNLILMFFFLVLWRPVWRIRFGWDRQVVRYYLNFGWHNFASGSLLRILDKIDDLWVRVYLGNIALADYSRAYTLATYPRELLARAIDEVAVGAYAELKHDRRRLSQAFFRTNALLVRTSFFLAGGFALIAPEFILIFLTEKWLSMLTTFQLMLLFTLLDPIKLTVGLLFNAVGKPQVVLRARIIQFVVLIVLLYLLGFRWGIAGVALAVDLMLLAGLGYLFWFARFEVDFSVWRLFAVPSLGIVTGLFLGWVSGQLLGDVSPWLSGFTKGVVFVAVYGVVLMLWERNEMRQMLQFVRKVLWRKSAANEQGK